MQKMILIEESDLQNAFEDMFCRLALNESRLLDNNGKINNNIINNINICIGMYKAFELLDLVDPVTEKNYKEYINLFY